MLTPVAQQAAARVGAASALLVKRCWFCEPDFGYHEETCSALEVFNNLEDALIEHDEAVLAAEEVHHHYPHTSCARLAPPRTSCVRAMVRR
tara:strand:- start:1430 stop:1702 length:273 start_codon:yes stop_codon:yes gene_type:complete